MTLARCWLFLVAVCSSSVFLVAQPPAPVAACQCVAGMGHGYHWRQADAIFQGRVLRFHPPETRREGNIIHVLPPYRSTVEMDILRAWKGPSAGQLSLGVPGPTACGYWGDLTPGTEHVIWANEWPDGSGTLVASSCSPGAPIADARELLDYLEDPPGMRPAVLLPAACSVWVALLLLVLLARRGGGHPLFAPRASLMLVGIALGGVALGGLWFFGAADAAAGSRVVVLGLGPLLPLRLDWLSVPFIATGAMALAFGFVGAGLGLRRRRWTGLAWGVAAYILTGLGGQLAWNVWWREDLLWPHPVLPLFWPVLVARSLGWFPY
jgi:hypothetical protein